MADASTLLILATAILAGQTQPIDPFLPPSLTPLIKKASDAELDKNLGATNAMEALRAARAKLPASSREAIALDLRIAATGLRRLFLEKEQFPVPKRWEQVLSTFARLDLLEPNLLAWIKRGIDQHPDARARLAKVGKPGKWPIKAAILTRGSVLDRDKIAKQLSKALENAGAKLELVPAKDAPFVLTFAAEDGPREANGDSNIKVSFGAERIENGKVTWRSGMFRVEAAKDSSVALASALEWVIRIGGRDVFFHWLGENGFPLLLESGPSPVQDPHKGHEHGSHP